jgi:hypothetical protein
MRRRLLDLRDDVDRLPLDLAGTQRLADAALRVVVARGVDHAIAGDDRVRDGVDGVVLELVGTETEQGHLVAGKQPAVGLDSQGRVRLPGFDGAKILQRGVHSLISEQAGFLRDSGFATCRHDPRSAHSRRTCHPLPCRGR